MYDKYHTYAFVLYMFTSSNLQIKPSFMTCKDPNPFMCLFHKKRNLFQGIYDYGQKPRKMQCGRFYKTPVRTFSVIFTLSHFIYFMQQSPEILLNLIYTCLRHASTSIFKILCRYLATKVLFKSTGAWKTYPCINHFDVLFAKTPRSHSNETSGNQSRQHSCN